MPSPQPPAHRTDSIQPGRFLEWQGVLLAILAFVLMAFIAWLVSPGVGKWEIGFIQGKPTFATTDDTYRYFCALLAWQKPGLYQWSYTLPLGILFDGSMASFFHQNMLWMRLSHVLLASLAIYALYLSGRRLRVSPWLMLLCCLSLVLMPLYLVESVSFYGESLLTIDLGFLIYCYIHKKDSGLIFFTAIAPLIRPEGIFYLAPLFVQKLLQKKLKQAVLILLPGFLYGMYLLLSLPSLSLFQGWRESLQIISQIVYQKSSSPFAQRSLLYDLIIINPIWVLIGLCGLFLNRKLWPFWTGVLFWIYFLCRQIQEGITVNEPRYFLSTLPFLTLGFALALQWLLNKHSGKRVVCLICGLVLLLTCENLLQSDPVRYALGGRRWPLNVPVMSSPHFLPVSAALTQDTHAASLLIATYLKEDPTVDKLFVNTPALLKVLKPSQVPANVQVILNPVMPQLTYQYLGGYFYGMFPEGRHYGLYQFVPAPPYDFMSTQHTGLYVSAGHIPWGVTPLFSSSYMEIYRVYYREVDSLPATIIDSIQTP